MIRIQRVACWLATILVTVLSHSALGADESAAPFAKFVDDYFDSRFAWNPTEGTGAGFHQYDAQLDDRSAQAVAKQIARDKELLERLGTIRQGKLTADEAIDAEILDGQLRGQLLNLETMGLWRHNPMNYVSVPGDAIDGLMKRSFAPPADRLRSAISRMKTVPALLAAMRANIENPPREFTELSIKICTGSADFFRGAVRDWAKETAGKDETLLAEFDAANAGVLAAFDQTTSWLKQDLLPRSHGNCALGAENFSRKRLYDEMVATPLDKLLSIGEAALAPIRPISRRQRSKSIPTTRRRKLCSVCRTIIPRRPT